MNIFFNKHEQRLRAGWRIVLQFVLMMFIFSLAALGFTVILPQNLTITSAAPLFIGVITSVWFAAHYIDKRPLQEYGISINKLWITEFFIGAGIAGGAIGTVFLIQWGSGWISITGYGWNAETDLAFALGIGSFFLSMLMVGFHEELFSRGYQVLNLTEGLRHPKIGKRGTIIISVLLTSSLFGFLHFANPNASALSTFNITLAGIVLAIPFLFTGSLALSVGLHFSWNFIMAGVLGFPVSGKKIEFTVLQIQQHGATIWTGGAFGPEAGLLGLLGMAIMIGGSCVYIKMAGYELSIAAIFEKKYQPTMKSDEQAP